MNFNCDIFTKLDKDWALLTAGTLDDHNGMTVSWGGMGTLWGKPVVTVYVRHNRHTFGYMEDNEFFTLSFYGPENRKALGLMGSLSGRDSDKETAAGLKAVKAGDSVSFEQAEATLVCRKLYSADLTAENMPEEIFREFYGSDPIHRMYIGEVTELIEK